MIFADVLPSFLIKRITLEEGLFNNESPPSGPSNPSIFEGARPTGADPSLFETDLSKPQVNLATQFALTGEHGLNITTSTLGLAKLDIAIRNQTGLNWVRIPKLREYISIYVIQVDNKTLKSELQSRLYYPKNRYAELVPLQNDIERDPIGASLSQIADMYSSTNFDYHVLTLADVVNSNTFGQISYEGYNSRIYDFSTNNDMSFSVEFELMSKPTDLCYFCFAHLNLKAVKDDYNSIDMVNLFESRRGTSVFNKLNRISSNLSYDTAIQDGTVPEYMSTYIIQGTRMPYVGPVRKNTFVDSTSTRQVGSYAGFKTELTPTGRIQVKKVRLDKVSYKNNKVIIVPEIITSPDNFSDAYQELNDQDPLPAGNWFRYSYSDQFRMFKAVTDNKGIITRSSPNVESLLVKQLRKQDPIQGFIEFSKNSIGKQEVLMGFDYYNCLKNNSRFKTILENIPIDLKTMILQRSKILEASVSRHRVSNTKKGLGALGLNQDKDFENDTYGELIVKSRDNTPVRQNISYERMMANIGFSPNSRPSVTDMIQNFAGSIPRIKPAVYRKYEKICADIEEVKVLLDQETGTINKRYLLINDYSFQDINYGKFRYKLSLSIEDGTEYLLTQFYKELKKSIKDMSSFISFVQNNKGYDNILKQYKRTFVKSIIAQYLNSNNQSNTSYLLQIDKAIYNYVQVRRLIEPNSAYRSSLKSSVEALYKVVDPTKNSTLDLMRRFIENLNILEKRLSTLLNNKDNTSFLNLKTNKKDGFASIKEVKTINVEKMFYKTSQTYDSSVVIDYSGKYEEGLDRDTSSVLQKNLAARQAIKSQTNADTRSTTQGIKIDGNNKSSLQFGSSQKLFDKQKPLRGIKKDSTPDKYQNTNSLLIYPSTIMFSKKHTSESAQYEVGQDFSSAQENKIINSSDIKNNLSNAQLLATLSKYFAGDTFSDAAATGYATTTKTTLVSRHVNVDGLTIGTINATDNSKSKVFKDKDEIITENFNNLISNNIFIKNKDEDFNKNKLEQLKEEKIISNSSAYQKYLNFLTKNSSYNSVLKNREDVAVRQDKRAFDLKTDFFASKAALVKHRVFFNNIRKENVYNYIEGKIFEMDENVNSSNTPNQMKQIKILKFEPIQGIEKEKINIANETLFLEV